MYTWPFGKYGGTPIDRIPTQYLAWAMENLDKPEPKAEAAKELARRRGGDGPGVGKPAGKTPSPAGNMAALIVRVGANVLTGTPGVSEAAGWLNDLIAGSAKPDEEEVPF